MTQYKHIVQVHPVENGEVNLSKVELEREFETTAGADAWIKIFNDEEEKYGSEIEVKAVYVDRVNEASLTQVSIKQQENWYETQAHRAVYRGCVNCETGELV